MFTGTIGQFVLFIPNDFKNDSQFDPNKILYDVHPLDNFKICAFSFQPPIESFTARFV